MRKTDDAVYLSFEPDVDPEVSSIHCVWKDNEVYHFVNELSFALSITKFQYVKTNVDVYGRSSLIDITFTDGDVSITVSPTEFSRISDFITLTERAGLLRYQDEGNAVVERTHDGSIWLYDGDHLAKDEKDVKCCLWYETDWEHEADVYEVKNLIDQVRYIGNIFNIPPTGGICHGK
jgi:hypothetical protein